MQLGCGPGGARCADGRAGAAVADDGTAYTMRVAGVWRPPWAAFCSPIQCARPSQKRAHIRLPRVAESSRIRVAALEDAEDVLARSQGATDGAVGTSLAVERRLDVGGREGISAARIEALGKPLDPHLQALRDDGWRSVLAVPMLRQGHDLLDQVLTRAKCGTRSGGNPEPPRSA